MRTLLPLALIFLCTSCGRSGMGLGRGRDAGADQRLVPAVKGDTAGGMADECNWGSPDDPGAPAMAIALSGPAEAMSFRIRVAIHASAYAHQGYVSEPSLTGPLSGLGMDVRGPRPGATRGEYFFDLLWISPLAPEEGMTITLSATFSFACSPSMSLTFDATTTIELLLCREGAGRLAWRGPGQTCDTGEAGLSHDARTWVQTDRPSRWQKVSGLSEERTSSAPWATCGGWRPSRGHERSPAMCPPG